MSSFKTRLFPKKYEGSAKDICEAIINDCWNGQFFQTSTTNFPQFWTRDFGWCIASLLKLGYRKEVHQTLRYALNRFVQHKKITTTITPQGEPYDFPNMAIDSLPWLIHSIKISDFSYHNYKNFLNKEILKYYKTVIDLDTKLVKKNKIFSSIKDFSIRNSSCYDNCMVALLAKDLATMKFINPFKGIFYKELIIENFWNGKFFFDDLNKKKYVAGDANLFPFLLGIINDKEMLKSAIKFIEQEELDKPYPLKYTSIKDNKIKFIIQEVFLKDYESNSCWMHMGPLYVKLLSTINPNKAEEFKQKYTELIEKHGTFLEVLDSNGNPFKTPFYVCDRGMLWGANYLTL